MRVSVLGYGTVGVGVCEMLEKAEGLELRKVLVRPGKADKPFKVTSIEEICADPETDAVVEVMGGVEPAFSFVSAALRAGKHAVTSNKALVAAHGPELARLAAEKGVGFLFSAACGGAVPFPLPRRATGSCPWAASSTAPPTSCSTRCSAAAWIMPTP